MNKSEVLVGTRTVFMKISKADKKRIMDAYLLARG